MNRQPFTLLTLGASFFLLLESPAQVNPAARSAKEEYSVKLTKADGFPPSVSSLLSGCNAVYANETDEVWSEGKIEGYFKDLNVSVVRFPGGTVCSFYHWNAMTGEGWKDSWDPAHPVTPKDKSQFMDLDEFIAIARRSAFTPLLGVNMSSGRRWNRTEDGIKEAIDLMNYCRDQNFVVKYWYLDNEPYQRDSNGGSKTIEEYARLVNAYASRMRSFNPDIKIIVNWNSAFKNKRDDYRKLLSIAGANIDIVDAHWYWSWNKPTFEKWLAKTPMELWTGDSYTAEIAYFRQMVKDFGYPEIKLASLEWNVGPIKEGQLTPHQCALIQSEMMLQFMMGGLDMATFWPLQGAGEALTTRSLVQRNDRSPQPVFHILKFLGKIQGSHLVKNEIINPIPHVLSLVAIDEKARVIRVCLLNKNGRDVKVNVSSDLFKNAQLAEASAFVLTNQGKGSDIRTMTLTGHTGAGISFVAFETSFTMLSFKEK